MSGSIWGTPETVTNYFYMPSRAGQAGMSEFERRNNAPYRFGWNVEALDDYLIPMNPGDLVVVLARPGHGKTSALVHLMRQANHTIEALYPISDNLDDARPIPHAFYATWETLIEEFVALFLASSSGCSLEDIGRGKADLPAIERAIASSVHNRIAVVGQSMSSDIRARRPPTLDDLNDILDMAAELGAMPAFLGVDYLQRCPSNSGRNKDRSMGVSENLELLKDMALRHRVPVVVGVQAKREVDEYSGLKLPSLSDGQWTSTIEQTADKVISLSRPFLYAPHKAFQMSDGSWYASTPTSLAVSIPKQRWGRSGAMFMLDMHPPTTTIRMAEPLDEGDELVEKAKQERSSKKKGRYSDSDEDVPF